MNISDKCWETRLETQDKRPNDERNDWERDYARLIHSSAFRRLQGKTQVLGLGESDFYRTRLTHSMEVAQIGGALLKRLHDKYKDKDKDKKFIGILPDNALIQTICLAHDIGHPPFGHGGEVALNYCMQNFGGFEGNGQTLRIISRLEKHTEECGINPTRRMMLGILKYPVCYSNLVKKELYPEIELNIPKWQFKAKAMKPPKCYLDTEEGIVNFIIQPFSSTDKELFSSIDDIKDKHNSTKYKSLDCSIMDLADEISYSIHDLEDAISLGLITKDIWLNYFNDKKNVFSDAHTHTFKDTAETLANDLFANSYKRKGCIGRLINFFISNVEYEIQNKAFISPLLKYKVILPNEINKLRESIAKLVKDKVILTENVQLLEFKGQKIVVELFNVLKTDPERFLPSSTKKIYEGQQNEKLQIRIICDFIAGMTDDYATRFYEKLFCPHKGSIFDKL